MLNSTPKLLGGAVAVVALATAFTTFDARAQTIQPIYSGGGTLAANVYRDLFNCWGSNSGGSLGTTTGTSCASITNPDAEVLYAPVGSGAGQNAYDTNTATALGTPSSASPPYVSSDFPGYPYTGLAFGAGDAPLSPAQVSATAALGFGPAIQIPTLVSSVTVPFNATGLTIVNSAPTVDGDTGTSGLMLSRNNLCGIFSGAINDWSDTNLAVDNGGTPLASTPTTIKVVYRHDSSGTTFLFSNALVTQCASSAHPMPTAWGTVGSTTYFTHAATLPGFPSNFYDEEALDGGSETGSGGIVDAVGVGTTSGNAATISYVSPDYAAPHSVGSHPSPITANVQNQASVTAGVKKFIPPGIDTANLIMNSAPAPTSASANAWATAGINPNPAGTETYPIGGFTWMYLYTCYASSTVTTDLTLVSNTTPGLLRWMTGTFTSAPQGSDVPVILNNHGFSAIPDAWKIAIRNDYFRASASAIRTAPSAGVCSSGAVAS